MVDVAALVRRVAELEIVVAELTARIRQLEVQAPVTAASATPSEAGLSSAAAGPAASEVLVASSPPVTFTPVPSDTGSLPDAKVRHYAVVEPNAYGQRGIYRSYSRFSDAVRGRLERPRPLPLGLRCVRERLQHQAGGRSLLHPTTWLGGYLLATTLGLMVARLGWVRGSAAGGCAPA